MPVEQNNTNDNVEVILLLFDFPLIRKKWAILRLETHKEKAVISIHSYFRKMIQKYTQPTHVSNSILLKLGNICHRKWVWVSLVKKIYLTHLFSSAPIRFFFVHIAWCQNNIHKTLRDEKGLIGFNKDMLCTKWRLHFNDQQNA